MDINHQRGLSTLGTLVMLAIGGFFLTVAMKVGPLYLDNYFVDAALQSLRNERVHEMSDREIRRKVSDYFTVNNVRDVNVLDLQIEKQKTHTVVHMDYERRINFMGNLDVVIVFKNQYDSSKMNN